MNIGIYYYMDINLLTVSGTRDKGEFRGDQDSVSDQDLSLTLEGEGETYTQTNKCSPFANSVLSASREMSSQTFIFKSSHAVPW